MSSATWFCPECGVAYAKGWQSRHLVKEHGYYYTVGGNKPIKGQNNG